MMTKTKSPRIAILKYISILPIAFLITALFAFKGSPLISDVDKDSIISIDSIPGKIYKVVEEMPRFPGCEDSGLTGIELFNCSQQKLLEFVYTEMKYPEEARLNKVEGRSIAQFIVRQDGRITDIEIVRSIGHGTDAEVQRVLNAMPAWRPGYHQGKAVDVQFTIPVSFKLEADPANGTPAPSTAETAYAIVEEMPRFPGCENSGLQGEELRTCSYEKLSQFLQEHMRYPEAAKNAGVEGRGIIQFVIAADGQLRDGKVVRSIGYGTDQELMRLFTAMQNMSERWTPGYQGGKAVDVVFTLPVTFSLPKE